MPSEPAQLVSEANVSGVVFALHKVKPECLLIDDCRTNTNPFSANMTLIGTVCLALKKEAGTCRGKKKRAKDISCPSV